MPKGPQVFGWTDTEYGPRVAVRLVDHRTTPDIYWSVRYNSYVLAEVRSNATPFEQRQAIDFNGRKVQLVSVNGMGEVRWTVEQWAIDCALRDEKEEWWDRVNGDGKEQLAAARHFGLAPKKQP
jgi:hypothetical protein